MQPHPLAEMFPAMSGEEYQRLKSDIAEHGLLHSIVEYEGKILDGRHRYRACMETGRQPRIVPYEGSEPDRYVYSTNIAKRNLSVSQRALVAARFKGYYAEQAKQRMRAGGGDRKSGVVTVPHPIPDTGKARDKAADAFGVSGSTVDKAEVVLKTGVPELIQAVEEDSISINQGVRIAALSKDTQKKVVAMPTAKIRGKALQRSGNQSKGAAMRKASAPAAQEAHQEQPNNLPGSGLVQAVLARVEMLANDIERRGVTPQQFTELFIQQFDWKEPILVRRLAHCAAAISALGKLGVAAEKALRSQQPTQQSARESA